MGRGVEVDFTVGVVLGRVVLVGCANPFAVGCMDCVASISATRVATTSGVGVLLDDVWLENTGKLQDKRTTVVITKKIFFLISISSPYGRDKSF